MTILNDASTQRAIAAGVASKFSSRNNDSDCGNLSEIESGRKNDRPQWVAALEACQLQKVALVIAKLDRLARNVAFLSKLLESTIQFVAVDMPEANRLTIHILVAVGKTLSRSSKEHRSSIQKLK